MTRLVIPGVAALFLATPAVAQTESKALPPSDEACFWIMFLDFFSKSRGQRTRFNFAQSMHWRNLNFASCAKFRRQNCLAMVFAQSGSTRI
jgi:hypothetical protein